MSRFSLGRGILFSAVIALGCLSSVPARAADTVDNPKYTAWAKFKPGSTSTVAADLERQGKKYHLELTRTLISVDADKAVVEYKTVVSVAGHDHATPATQQTFTAKVEKVDFKETGEKDVEAMGKTFKCKVYEAAGDDAAADAKGPPSPDSMKATVCINDDVPGGLVRLDGTDKAGNSVTFVLTAMEAK